MRYLLLLPALVALPACGPDAARTLSPVPAHGGRGANAGRTRREGNPAGARHTLKREGGDLG